MARRVFAIAAHPDDIEYMMAGTLALLGQAGYELHCMNVANGSCGTVRYDAAETAAIRHSEAEASAGVVGATLHPSLCNDLEIFYEPGLLRRLAAVIRQVAPSIILTHPPQDYMEDHTNTCRLVVTAAFARGMPNFPVDPPAEPVSEPVTIYHAMPYGLRDGLGRPASAGCYVDIEPVLEIKRRMLSMHRSQQEWLDVSQGLNSYLAHMEEMSRAVGRLSGRWAVAEGWTRHLPLGFCGEDDDPLREALGDRIA